MPRPDSLVDLPAIEAKIDQRIASTQGLRQQVVRRLLPLAVGSVIFLSGCLPGPRPESAVATISAQSTVTIPTQILETPIPLVFPTSTPVIEKPIKPLPTEIVFDERFYKDRETYDLKRTIEKKFGVEIFTSGEINEKRFSVDQSGNNRFYPGHPDLAAAVWDSSKLQMLQTFFDLLPDHFHQPRKEDGAKLHVILSTYPDACDCFELNPKRIIIDFRGLSMNYKNFNPEHKKKELERFTHENVHAVTPIIRLSDTKITSPWFDTIDSILGQRFNDARKIYHERLTKLRGTINPEIRGRNLLYPGLDEDTDLTPEETQELFYSVLDYGLGYDPNGTSHKDNIDAREFIAVIGEHYIHGKQYFTSMYSKVFDEERANKLYDFVKEDIFQGKEYSKFPIK